jgi:hypothetical protein
MKSFGIAFRLWMGTLLINAGVMAVFAVFSFNGFLFVLALIAFILGIFISTPLLISAVGLVRLSCKLPYSAGAKIWWLAFMLLLQNFVYLYMLGRVDSLFFELLSAADLFYPTGFALVIMLFASRTILKNYYLQQTSNKQL